MCIHVHAALNSCAYRTAIFLGNTDGIYNTSEQSLHGGEKTTAPGELVFHIS